MPACQRRARPRAGRGAACSHGRARHAAAAPATPCAACRHRCEHDGAGGRDARARNGEARVDRVEQFGLPCVDRPVERHRHDRVGTRAGERRGFGAGREQQPAHAGSASRAASCAGHASPVAHQTSACDRHRARRAGIGCSTTVPVAAMPERATVKPASIVSNSSVFHASIGRSNGTGTTVSGSARERRGFGAGRVSSRRTPASASARRRGARRRSRTRRPRATRARPAS